MSAPLPNDDPAARLIAAADAYAAKFGVWPNIWMFGVSVAYMSQTLEAAVQAGKPLAADHDWYSQLPPGAMA